MIIYAESFDGPCVPSMDLKGDPENIRLPCAIFRWWIVMFPLRVAIIWKVYHSIYIYIIIYNIIYIHILWYYVYIYIYIYYINIYIYNRPHFQVPHPLSESYFSHDSTLAPSCGKCCGKCSAGHASQALIRVPGPDLHDMPWELGTKNHHGSRNSSMSCLLGVN